MARSARPGKAAYLDGEERPRPAEGRGGDTPEEATGTHRPNLALSCMNASRRSSGRYAAPGIGHRPDTGAAPGTSRPAPTGRPSPPAQLRNISNMPREAGRR